MKYLNHPVNRLTLLALCVLAWCPGHASAGAPRFDGLHYAGTGDVEYLRLLDIARRQFEVDPEYQNLSMLYQPRWNGLVEGPTWDMWWIQNSYGTSYCWLPLMTEPWTTFLQNSQDLWFKWQADGKTKDANGYVAPDGCLVDAASPEKCYYRQGDGRVDIHDWFMEATAAGVVLQGELLLISRDETAIERYLPQLERAANFIETRRDPATGLYLGGPACNLLAPSFAGYKKPDGTYGKAYHAGLQVTYIAALDRLIELEKLAGHNQTAGGYQRRRELARKSLPKLLTSEGYFVNSLDPDGTKHGVFGAAQHGYFESSVNHDAICFRVADDALAKSIYAKMVSIPQLRPHHLIIPNYPSYDDLYDINWGLWKYGYWTNGGQWSTCEARMIMAYYRLGHTDDARASMQQMLNRFARRFRMDNNLTDFGNAVYQPQLPINITYDAFGPSAALMRGLFEYLYKADRLVLVPHIPSRITSLQQRDPVRFGTKKIYLSTIGSGVVTGVILNGEAWTDYSPTEVTLPYDRTPQESRITILLGGAAGDEPAEQGPAAAGAGRLAAHAHAATTLPADLAGRAGKLRRFASALDGAGLDRGYVAAHARLAADAIEVIPLRQVMLAEKKIDPLPEPAAAAAEKAYRDAAEKLYAGFTQVMGTYAESDSPAKQHIAAIWRAQK